MTRFPVTFLKIFFAVASALAAISAPAQTTAYTVSTVAGGGNPPYPGVGDGGAATGAYLSSPLGVAVDSGGNLLIAESRLRKVTSSGIISTLATYNSSGVAVDNSGNIYVAVTTSGGSLFKIAGSGAGAALTTLPAGSFGGPDGIAVDAAGNIWYSWRGAGGHVVSKISVSGSVAVVAGGGSYSPSLGDGGPAAGAYLNEPRGLATDAAGNLYIADFGNNRIRKVSTDGSISSVGGTGLSGPSGVAVDTAGNIFVTQFYSNRVSVIRADGSVANIGGTGAFGSSGDNGPATAAAIGSPYGIAVSNGRIYVTTTDGLVRLLTPAIPPPSITPGGIGPLFSSATTVQPGEWISIYGSNLATGTFVWDGTFPISLGGTSVTVNGKAAYLWFVSPTQINLQTPDDTATGAVAVVVKTANGSFSSTVTLAQQGPSWNLLDSKHVTGIILRSNGSGAYGGGAYDILGPTGTSLGYPTVAAKAGDSIALFGVGFGPTTPPVLAGQSFSGSAPLSTPVSLLINNVAVVPSFAGLSGAGLYQFNLVVPAGLGSGDVPLLATANGVQTPAGVVISLQ